ncbi:MAG: DUF1080 domain-containing protein [Planctomycetaceae bacterium]|nr:DUF1080 domain-containing protein [Planctomycetaceae bacterium]MBT4158068.1 DUF1080 domain-containing protein [Planctomycetaceae bacterium]MBT6054066.1 DUF1080 domain-containing protein [Planctomycetaceae bacterium]MBT6642029.1 DUF1080 domain-containing protein [Planctomycetaceae bacterium]MBT6920602.1 DUF1080 domain-containing protein [Planctomycetaceae bacterium]
MLKNILVTDFEFIWHVKQNSGICFQISNIAQLPDHPPTKNVSNNPNQWNHMHIRCVANQITVSVNDEIMNQNDLNNGAAGRRSKYEGFAFQDHVRTV